MELEKQNLLISYLVSSQELFVKVSPIIKSNYFDPKLKSSVSFIQKYFNDYKAPPTPEQVKAETNFDITLRPSLTRQEMKYAENEIEIFCRNKAIENAIMASPALLAEGKHGDIEKLIRDAITVSLQRNIGLDYFQDPELRLKSLSLNNFMIPTKFTKLDEYLGGGLNRKELTIIAAPSGVGKSVTMGNFAKNLMSQRLNGVYITMELAAEVVAKRFDSMFSGLEQGDILKNITKTVIEINKHSEDHGRLFIKRMPESSTHANHIRAYLKEFEIVNGFLPDFMVVDYMDLMCPVQSGISGENMSARDKYISEELRAIGDDYNMIMISASQLGRGVHFLEDAVEDLSQGHIAGGISKINTCDNCVAIIQTPQMKARGEMMFKLLKTRSSNGVGKHFMMKFSAISLLLENLADDDQENKTSKNLASYIRGKVALNQEATSTAKPASKLTIDNLPFKV